MRLALVRHARAGSKADWSGPDAHRPLDVVGFGQAQALVGLFDGRQVGRLLASPTRRCRQTLEPLARRRGLAVVEIDELRADVEPVRLWAFLTGEAPDAAVLCTHGEALESLLPLLRQAGLSALPAPDDVLLAKGSVWLLEVDVDVAGAPVVSSFEHLVAVPEAVGPSQHA